MVFEASHYSLSIFQNVRRFHLLRDRVLPSSYKESIFNISVCEYAAPMTLSLPPDVSRGGAVGRVRQKGEVDLAVIQYMVIRATPRGSTYSVRSAQ